MRGKLWIIPYVLLLLGILAATVALHRRIRSRPTAANRLRAVMVGTPKDGPNFAPNSRAAHEARTRRTLDARVGGDLPARRH
jgi:hypothetical protein